MVKKLITIGYMLVGLSVLMYSYQTPVLAEDIECVIPSVNQDAQYGEQYENHIYNATNYSPYKGSGSLQGLYVASNGWFTLVSNEGVTHYVDVYNASCELVYQLVLNDSGTILATFDSYDGKLILYPFRHNVLIKVDEEGKYLFSEPVVDYGKEITKLHALEPFTVEYLGQVYTFYGNKLFSKNSQTFCIKNSCGIVKFIYTPKSHTQNVVVLCVGVSIISVIGISWCKRRSTGDGSRPLKKWCY